MAMKEAGIPLSISLMALVLGLPVHADKTKQAQQAAPQVREQRVVQARRAEGPITIDGRLDENVWQGPAAEGFTQSDPKDGDPSSERTRVWVAYDDASVYVAAYCHDSEPGKIVSRLGRRDSEIDSDWFYFAVDPYYDRRSGYMFGVNPAGSILD